MSETWTLDPAGSVVVAGRPDEDLLLLKTTHTAHDWWTAVLPLPDGEN